jgi:hypothetical protein
MLFQYVGREVTQQGYLTGSKLHAETQYSRATSLGEAPGAKLCAAIACFSSAVQRRRRSPRVINSIRALRALL